MAPLLRETVYANDALVPASPWLDNEAPKQPELIATSDGRGGAHLSFKARGKAEDVWVWALYYRSGGIWRMQVLAGNVNHFDLKQETATKQISVVAIAAVDRSGNESKRRVVEINKEEK